MAGFFASPQGCDAKFPRGVGWGGGGGATPPCCRRTIIEQHTDPLRNNDFKSSASFQVLTFGRRKIKSWDFTRQEPG